MKTGPVARAYRPAPCGITCGACYARVRKKNPCVGCREEDEAKPNYCRTCRIKLCAEERGFEYCVDCPDFPCKSIRHIDKRYRLGYQVSLVEGARYMKTVGIRQYLREEKARWTCPKCGGIVSLHTRICSECGRRLDRTA